MTDEKRLRNAMIYGTSHPEIYKTALDEELERLRADTELMRDLLESLVPSDAMIASRKKIQDALLHSSDFKPLVTKKSKKYKKIFDDLKKNWREND